MKKFLFILLCLYVITISFSCNRGNGDKTAVEKGDTVWAESIQGTFFDTPFGASREAVVENFCKHGFVLDEYNSTDTFLSFGTPGKRGYSFGGMTWELLNVYLNNGKFYAITFYNATTDKATALSNVESIKNTVGQKYPLNDYTDKSDTTIFKCYAVSTKNDKRQIVIECNRYESISNGILIGATLTYVDRTYEKSSNEL